MTRTEIKIDRIQIRGKGISPPVARAAASGLGQQLLHELAQHGGNFPSRRAVHIDRLDLGTVKVPRTGNTRQVKTAIAAAVVRELTSRSNQTGGQ